ncbi:MAG TPA: peptide-binding protein [Candidatus Acidoferrum sp.]|nr:peptide-binding protein [Candidatus Acidoferrum sp.]
MRAVLLVLLLAAALAGCTDRRDDVAVSAAPRPTGDRAYGDTLIRALAANISGLIPNIVGDKYSHDAVALVYNGLITHDKDTNIVPDLAESWDLAADCRELTFRLRKNARWHDGRAFTADDVVFTYQLMSHPKTPSPYKDDFEDVTSVEALDPYTVRVRYKSSYANALMIWGQSMLPKHLLESYMLAGKLKEAPQNFTTPVGTGPYKFHEIRAGEKIVLVANPDYYAGRPYISRIVYRIIPSQATIFLELKAKGIDQADLTALQYQRQTDYPAFKSAYNKFRYADKVYNYLGLNHTDRRFADKRVRQAFAHAINKRDLIEGVRFGMAREATGPYKHGTWVYNPNVRTYPYDPARARKLLAEAGWTTKNAEGLLVKDGQPFTFELLISQGSDEGKKIAEIIQSQLRDVGVGVELRVLEWAALLKEHIKKHRFAAAAMAWSTGLDPDQYSIWHSSQTGPDEFNFVSYKNPEVDGLLERGRRTCRQSERKRVYDRLQEIFAEEQPLVFLYFRDTMPAVAARVQGIVPGPIGIDYNMYEWYVPKQLQLYMSE